MGFFVVPQMAALVQVNEILRRQGDKIRLRKKTTKSLYLVLLASVIHRIEMVLFTSHIGHEKYLTLFIDTVCRNLVKVCNYSHQFDT